MNALQELIAMPCELQTEAGVVHTPKEILQQPAMWSRMAESILEKRAEVLSFMDASGLSGTKRSVVILTGAGSSEFVGNAVAGLLQAELEREVRSIPTTHLVTHAREAFVPGSAYCVVSFARSGNSPESVATWERVSRYCPQAAQLVITCNRSGALARRAERDPNALCLVLPHETHDQSLVMTSSYSTMAWTAALLCLLSDPPRLQRICQLLVLGAARLLNAYPDVLDGFSRIPFRRVCFLGSGTLYGTMQECALKMQEMTEGRIATRHESFLGLRHGPQVFVDGGCVVVAAVSSETRLRRYEIDMLRELKEKGQGCGTLAVCGRSDEELDSVANQVVELYPDGECLPDPFRAMTDVIVGQLLGTFKSLGFGLRPDAPSSSGIIHRVVQGVRIYAE